MTNEEIQGSIKEIDESLAKLPEEKSRSKEQRRERVTMLMEKDALEQIKQAREKGNIQQEIKHTVSYAVLKSVKNPWLMYLMQIKFRSHIFS